PDLMTLSSTMTPRLVTQTFDPTGCDVVEGMVQPGTRKLVRFTFTTPNRGQADLIVGPPSLRPDLFEYSECHAHYHFREYADYRLWTPAQFEAWSALRDEFPELTPAAVLQAHPELSPVRGAKRGFCVIDLRRVSYTLLAFSKYNSCDFQGISVGWADEYHYSLAGQYLDVTGLPQGDYVLEAEVNAERLFGESNYANNRGWLSIAI
ncbi:MAG: lysyl oxidase family protein, partial [Actinomycetota bacterium]